MKKKILIALILSVVMLSGCGSTTNEQLQEENSDSSVETDASEDELSVSEDELSQSEWIAQHADETEDGYEVVDAINIDSGDTKLEYTSSEKYTLESGEEILLVNFTFTNVSAGTTSLDAQYNFQAFQDGVEITVYSWLGDEVDGDVNRGKEILDGASLEVSVGIAPENWESSIKLRVDDVMAYDDVENIGHTYQQQEIEIPE